MSEGDVEVEHVLAHVAHGAGVSLGSVWVSLDPVHWVLVLAEWSDWGAWVLWWVWWLNHLAGWVLGISIAWLRWVAWSTVAWLRWIAWVAVAWLASVVLLNDNLLDDFLMDLVHFLMMTWISSEHLF